MEIPERRAPDRRLLVAAPVLLVAAVLLIYGQTLGHRFVNFDDPVYITDNPHVLRGLTTEGAQWAFSTGLTGMWHPLTWLSLMANVQWFGPGPAGFHAVNVALHAASTLLLYALLLSATGAIGRSVFTALLFAVHPLNVESVAWASQRKSYDRRGDKTAALATLQDAVARTPWDANIRNHLGSVLSDLGRTAEAEAELREAIRLRSDYAEPWINLGVLYAQRGQLEPARSAFERAVAINPYVTGGAQNLARVRADLAARAK